MSISINTDRTNCKELIIEIEVLDLELIGKKASLTVNRIFNVKNGRGNDQIQKIKKEKFEIIQRKTIFKIQGIFSNISTKDLEIKHKCKVVIKKDWAIDIKTEHDINYELTRKPTKKALYLMMKPKDKFSYIKNLKAIDPLNRSLILLVFFFSGCLIVANTLIGLHDQMAPESMIWFYSHYGSSEKTYPLAKAFFGNLGVFAWARLFIKHQLKKYMDVFLKVKNNIPPSLVLPAKELVCGSSKVDLKQVKIRVVAGNMAHGSYQRRSGSNKRTVWFKKPIKALILYEQLITHVPAGAALSDYLTGEVAFKKAFEALFPSCMNGKTGVSFDWKIQLIHDEFIDQEIKMKAVKFPDQYFYFDEDSQIEDAA